MNIPELQRTVHAIAVEKGWHDQPLLVDGKPNATRVLAKLALVHSELSEAEIEASQGLYDVYFNDEKPTKPEGWIVEIADTLIRVLDTCEALGVEITDHFSPARQLDWQISEHCQPPSLHGCVSMAVEAVRKADYDEFGVNCALLWMRCQELITAQGTSLEFALNLKIAYNRTRPHMHGGKLA